MTDENKTRSQLIKELHEMRKRIAVMERNNTKEYHNESFEIINESSMSVIVWRNEEGWPVDFVTDNIINVLGYSSEELLSGRVRYDQIIHPEDLPRVQQEVAGFSVEKNRERFIHKPYRILTPKGDIRWIEDRTGIERDEKGDITRYRGIILDISERKRVESELADERSRLASIIEGAQVGTWEWNVQTGETVFNEIWAQIVGYTLEELAPVNIDTWISFAHPEDIKGSDELLNKHFAGELSLYNYECRMRHKDGHWVWVHDQGRLMSRDAEGAPLLMFGTHQDITERKRMEEMVIQNEKMLSVGGLAAGMAHEINNPLAGMLQNAEVLSQRLKTDSNIPANLKAADAAGTTMKSIEQFMEDRGIQRMIRAITESGQRISEIVTNMLSFARKEESVVSTHHLDKILDKAIELAATDYDLKKTYDFKQIKIIRKYDENLPAIPCQATKIQQVLLNILTNGAQAMQTVKTVPSRFILRIRKEKSSDMIRIEIEDNGPGMDEKNRSKVFDPFFTTKPVGIGTGLGLSVSYFIITENHNGIIDVISEPGKGANFIIRLPVHRKN